MKVDFNVAFKDFSGTDVINEENKKIVLIKDLCVNSLLTEYPGQVLTGVQKLGLATLAKKIFDAEGEEEYTAEEIVQIKEYIAKRYNPLAVWALNQIVK